MHISVSELGPCKKKLDIEIEKDNVISKYKEKFDAVRKGIALPGFRQGKVPVALIQKRFGEEIEKETKEELISDSFEKAIKDYNLKPLGDPTPEGVEFQPAEGTLKYSVTLEVLPEFDLPEYKGIEATRVRYQVTDEMVSQTIKDAKTQSAQWAPGDGEIGDEDLVTAKVAVVIDGNEVARNDDAGIAPQIGSVAGIRIGDAVKENLVGKKAGDLATIPFTVGENKGRIEIPKEYEGKEATIQAEIVEFKRRNLPSDEEILKMYDFDTMDEMTKEIRKNLEKDFDMAADEDVENEIVKKLVESVNMDLPKDTIDREVKIMEQKRRMELQNAGKKEEEIEEEMKKFNERSLEEIEKSFKAQLIVEKVAEKEKIFCTEDDIAERISSMAARYGRDPKELYSIYERQGLLNSLRQEIKASKVRKLLREKAQIVDKVEELPTKTEDKKE